MLRTKLPISFFDIPSEWIFEYYLNLNVKLIGQSVKIKSIFNPKDKDPSMNLFYSEQHRNYRFFDFSTGIGGGCIEFVKLQYPELPPNELYQKVVSDYESSDGKSRISESVVNVFKVSDFTIRKWNTDDVKFWTKYNIGSRILNHYNVLPLKDYTCYWLSEAGESTRVVSKSLCYGYFSKSGELYKIYSPNSDLKFLTLKTVVQGLDQLAGKSYLLIGSSLKDIMSIFSMNITNLDLVAPASENTQVSSSLANSWKNSYKKVITLFDNDQPGINAMERYKTLYGFPYAHLKLSKDISDSIVDFGIDKVRTELLILLKHIIHE